MFKIIIQDPTKIRPFNEPARELRILNKPLWLHQRDLLRPYCTEEYEVALDEPIEETDKETIIYKDNLYFDENLFEAFLKIAKAINTPCQIAFDLEDAAIVNHALPLQSGIRQQGDVYVADLYYYPDGYSQANRQQLVPLIIDTKSTEIGYYHIPTYMAYEKGDLVYNVPKLPLLSIESWIHIYLANTIFGIFSMGARIEAQLNEDFSFLLKILFRSLLERKQFLGSSPVVKIGKNCQIDPAAIIQGPTIIGDNVTIGPGAVINACIIGDNVNISQGCQLMLSVIGSGTFLPFRAALFMTTLMENAMVAQNTCLQMCVVGRNSFIGAGNTFTDFNLLARPIRTMHKGKLVEVQQPVIGGCVGHNCRIGSGHIIFPGRTIESDVVLFAKNGQNIISKDVRYEDSDHHNFPNQGHIPLYHPEEESSDEAKE
ncbi:MAG: multidrug transporter [Aliifodinibius sp.]|nr:multidrug transporter [Fodinibius sp.]NIX00473.1 multidrug transporter [Phycisphaerae bacterium]NIY24399.1 multidrug transporter [Fodinibius sp.]